ncbi:endo-1,4-beta-xylanase [Paenibacillus sp. YIM B09110]|uniref:endo-1,4-beta-xylanase n=1 Tax=Paenibacillus sp. YIM B09110 TaxID=3126102 RepID=UPI00301CF899
MRRKLKVYLSLLLAVALLLPQVWTGESAHAAAVGDVVLANNFDTNTDGWFKRGSETVVQSTYTAHTGAGSLKTTGRTENWNGPGTYLDTLVKGATYELSVYAKLLEDTAGEATLEINVNQEGLPAGDSAAYKAVRAETVTAGEWVEIKGNITLDPRATKYQLYVQASGNATVSYYIDTFKAKLVALPVTDPVAPVAATVLSQDFEDGSTGGWLPLSWGGSGTVAISQDQASSGSHSLRFSGRTTNSASPSLSILSYLQQGRTYDISLKAKLGEGLDKLHVTWKNGSAFDWHMGESTVSSTEWTTFSKTGYTLPTGSSELLLYIETLASTADIYIDEVLIKDTTPQTVTKIVDQGFEDGEIGDWAPLSWGSSGSLSVSTDTASEGTHSLKFADRLTKSASPSISIFSKLQQGHTYDISLKAKLGEGSDNLHVTWKNGSAFDWHMGEKTVTSTEWTTFSKTGYTLPSGSAELLLYIESAASIADIYIDEFVIVDVTPGQTEPDPDPSTLDQTGITTGFEDGQGDWVRRNGDGNIEVSSDDNHTSGGANSLLTTVSDQYDGPFLNVLGKMHKNYEYSLSAWVKMAPGEDPTRLRLSVQSGDSTFTNVSANATVTDAAWVQLSGKFSLRTKPTVLNAYVETADDNGEPRSFYMDDFALAYVGPLEGTLPIQTGLDSLKDLYENYFEIGAAVEPAQFTGTADQLLKKHYSAIVAENSMKPASINATEGTYNYTGADAIVKYAKDNDMKLRFHTLLWHEQGADWMLKDSQGEWLEANETNKALVLSRLRSYIQAVVAKYADVADYYDVVNEVIDEGRPDGMRDTHWYRITGLDFIRVAFEEAHNADPTAKLYINDYSTHNPQKRDFLFDLVTKLRDEGVPIDGVGHQTHINVSGPSIQQMSDSIRKFGEAGFDNQLTELDISVYTNNSTAYDPIPEDILVRQGYRYKELFEELVKLDEEGKNADPDTEAYNPDGWISNVTIWGLADDHTWLHNRGTTRQDAPFPFDKRHQAKYAYWGMVEAVKEVVPPKLPLVTKEGSAAEGTPIIDGQIDAVWNKVAAMETERTSAFGASFKTLWDDNYLYVLADVQDSVKTSEDKAELFVKTDDGFTKYEIARQTSDQVTEKTSGYIVETAIPLSGNTVGKTLYFDIRLTTGGAQDGTEHGQNGAIVSWSDGRNIQHQDTAGYGSLTLVAAPKSALAVKGTPVIDGEEDAEWANAAELETALWVQGTSGSTAKFKTLWDEQYLYVYAVVTDAVLSDESQQAHEEDSVEIFVDQNNGKSPLYQNDDGQYRINFNNIKTVGGHASQSNYETATKLVPGVGYVVEAAILLDTITPAEGTVIGFDFQVNNDEDGNGTRDSVANWADPSGQSYQDTSKLGVLQFVNNTDTVLNPPANVTIRATSYNKLEVKWDAVDQAAGYNVYRATSESGPFVKRNAAVIEAETYNDSNLSTSTAYYYKISSVDANGLESPLSDAVSKRTGNAPSVDPVNPGSGSNDAVVPTIVSGGRALGIISNDMLGGKLAEAGNNADGVKEIVFELVPATGTNGYAIQLPTSALIDDEEYVISIKTDMGIIQLPSSMLAGMDISSDTVTIVFSPASLEDLSQAVRDEIGDRPVFDLHVLVNNEVVTWSNDNAPVTIIAPYEPTAEELESPGNLVVWYVDDNGVVTAVPNGHYDVETGSIVFHTTHFSMYAVAYVDRSFEDIERYVWAQPAIEALAARDIIKGTSSTVYSPAANIKRADFLLLLVRALELKSDGESAFADVAATAYYYDAVRIAKGLGIAKGDGNGRFNPNAPITRQEMMVLTARALEAAGQRINSEGSLASFSDAAEVADYARESAAALVASGIVNGIGGALEPGGLLTRAQAAVILYRLLGLV